MRLRVGPSLVLWACLCIPVAARAADEPRDQGQGDQGQRGQAELRGKPVPVRVPAPARSESLTPQQARDLVAGHDGDHLGIPGLTKLDAATAAVLVEFKGKGLRFAGLSALDVATAKALAGFKGEGLSISGLPTLDAATAEALAGFKGRKLFLWKAPPLDAATAAALAKFAGGELLLGNLATLAPATAEGLAKFEGDVLRFHGLPTIDAAAAEALAEMDGFLWFDGLKTMPDAATVEALAAFKGRGVIIPEWMINRVGSDPLPLTPATARLMCLHARAVQAGLVRSPLGMGPNTVNAAALRGVVAMDRPDAVEVATILAACEGWLALPNLKKISPKTLSALIEKPDVVIPLIEKLELIPEPDGSPNDDFAVPADLEQRQRLQAPRFR